MVEETLRQTLELVYDELTRNDGDLHGGSDMVAPLRVLHQGVTMSKDAQKSERELRVFREFSERSNLLIDPDSIESRPSPEPDILCHIMEEGRVAFELKECCDQDLAKLISELMNQRSEQAEYMRLSGPAPNFLQQTANKKYKSDFPIERLFYTDGRIIEPSDIIVQRIKAVYDNNHHPFRRVWFMGNRDEVCKCIWTPADA